MRRIRQRQILSRPTVISAEREFALYHRDFKPLSSNERDGVKERLTASLARLRTRTEVVPEVAGNSIEVKICFSTIERLRQDIINVYSIIEQVVRELNIYICGVSQPCSEYGLDEASHFMTTDVFSGVRKFFAATNSLHLHLGVGSEEEGIRLYNTANRIAPLLLAISQSSIIDNQDRGRALFISKIYDELPLELTKPWRIDGIEDFQANLQLARLAVEQIVLRMPTEERELLATRYPSFISADGRVLRLTPDKIFHPARLRPDLVCNERSLWGSVEIRALDGQGGLYGDLAHVEFALGLLAYSLQHGRTGIINKKESLSIWRSIFSIPYHGLSAIYWNGIKNAATAIEYSREGLHLIGIEPNFIHLARDEETGTNWIRRSCPIQMPFADYLIKNAHNAFSESLRYAQRDHIEHVELRAARTVMTEHHGDKDE